MLTTTVIRYLQRLSKVTPDKNLPYKAAVVGVGKVQPFLRWKE
jgi:hypothetical protein